MVAIDYDNILYLDTESKKDTGEPLYIQWRMNGVHGWLHSFTREDYYTLRALWWQAEAVIFFGAPYDIFTIAKAFAPYTSWHWEETATGSIWDLKLFGHHYKIRGISGLRNLIKTFNTVELYDGSTPKNGKRGVKSTPVIDFLKLWSILVDDGRDHKISLKALIERELKLPIYEYSDDDSLSIDYIMQDVDRLEDLWHVFLDRVKNIDDVRGYTYLDWSDIKTPATFVKKSYHDAYPELKTLRDLNMAEDEKLGLTDALEESYHGGMTLARYRGWDYRNAWFDISSAYANTIKHLNTDRYLRYTWEERNPQDVDIFSRESPYLCRVSSTVVLRTINEGLKIFTLDKPLRQWMWSFDIHALSLIFPEHTWEVLSVFEPIPLNPVSESMPTVWIAHKDALKNVADKQTLRDYYKFMSNTSYGIKAQRKPQITPHTNMCIAGMITSRAHLILFEMVDVAQKAGYKWLYSDTDSICVSYSGEYDPSLLTALNTRIAPFTCECEGYDFKTRILSLKRYMSLEGLPLKRDAYREKIKLHGKWIYDIKPADMKKYLLDLMAPLDKIRIKSLRASTPTTMKILLNKSPQREPWCRPFDFDTDIEGDVSIMEWFKKWFIHVDKKTWNPESASSESFYHRPFHNFSSIGAAHVFFASTAPDEPYDSDDMNDNYDGGNGRSRIIFPSTLEAVASLPPPSACQNSPLPSPKP
jgi:hypothetical protein